MLCLYCGEEVRRWTNRQAVNTSLSIVKSFCYQCACEVFKSKKNERRVNKNEHQKSNSGQTRTA